MMNNETYDDMVKTEDFSMISTIEEGKLHGFSGEITTAHFIEETR